MQSIADVVKDVIRLVPWTVARPVFIELCLLLAENTTYRGDILCPGVIDIQGPHVSSYRGGQTMLKHLLKCSQHFLY